MKYLLAVLLLAGCGANITPTEIKYAQDICATNGGLLSIHPTWHVGLWVEASCNNGVSFAGNVPGNKPCQ